MNQFHRRSRTTLPLHVSARVALCATLATVSLAIGPAIARGQAAHAAATEGEGFSSVIRDRLFIGTRITAYQLNKEHDDFLGSIDFLDAQQDYAPTKVFVDWLVTPNVGAEITWDRVEARTITSRDGHDDGSIVLEGPIVTAFLRLPFEASFLGHPKRCDASIGAGAAFFNASFVHVGWWHNGFPEGDNWREVGQRRYDEWIADGAPENPNNGYTRTMNLDNTVGFVITAACSAEIIDRLSLELYLRYMHVEVDDQFDLARYGDVFQSHDATFPMSNIAGGLGVKYGF